MVEGGVGEWQLSPTLGTTLSDPCRKAVYDHKGEGMTLMYLWIVVNVSPWLQTEADREKLEIWQERLKGNKEETDGRTNERKEGHTERLTVEGAASVVC